MKPDVKPNGFDGIIFSVKMLSIWLCIKSSNVFLQIGNNDIGQ